MPLADHSHANMLTDQSLLVGRVLQVNNRARVIRIESGARRLHPGDPVFRDDVFETFGTSWVTLGLEDGTEITLGANARLSLDRYFFDPKEGSGVLDAWALAGSFYVTSGIMTGHPSSIIAIRTPNAVLKLPPPGGVVAGKYIDTDKVSLFTLLADDFGRAGQAAVHSRGGEAYLSRANHTTVVIDDLNAPTRPVVLTRFDLFDLFGLFRDRGWRYSGIATGRLRLLSGAERQAEIRP